MFGHFRPRQELMARFHRLIRKTASVAAALLLLQLARSAGRGGGRGAGGGCAARTGARERAVSVRRSHAGRLRLQRLRRLCVRRNHRSNPAATIGRDQSARRIADCRTSWPPVTSCSSTRSDDRYSHVGIYVGDGRFIHAPARRGRVRVESIADPYWTSRFNGARRLFPASSPPRWPDGRRAPARSLSSPRGAHHALSGPAGP